MDAGRFHGWNVISGIVWVFVCLAPGYLTARGLWLTGANPRLIDALTTALAVLSVGLIVAAFAGIAWRFVFRRA